LATLNSAKITNKWPERASCQNVFFSSNFVLCREHTINTFVFMLTKPETIYWLVTQFEPNGVCVCVCVYIWNICKGM
jgi:hypothetical protein